MEIFACLAMSWDGKITAAGPSETWTKLGTEQDLNRLFTLRNTADVLVFGASTFRAWPSVRRGLNSDPTSPPPRACLLTRSWQLDWKAPLFAEWNSAWPPILVASANPPPTEIPASVEWIALPPDETQQAHTLIKTLKGLGLSTVMVEGGGEIVALFVQAGLLQRLELTVTPWLIGGKNTPTLMDGLGLTDKTSFARVTTTHTQAVGDEWFVTLAITYNES